jgi:hypothetical protein
MFKKGESITIDQVADEGFLVSPKNPGNLSELEDIHVFESIEGLKEFLDQHFKSKKDKDK